MPLCPAGQVSAEADLRKVGVAGCCVPTGVGAARVLAGVAAGASCAVWGLGAVGLATALGCKLAGAATVIGIDLSPAKEELGEVMRVATSDCCLFCVHQMQPFHAQIFNKIQFCQNK